MLQVRVIDDQGENHGVISIDDALEIADEAGLDLVEVSPQVEPPADAAVRTLLSKVWPASQLEHGAEVHTLVSMPCMISGYNNSEL